MKLFSCDEFRELGEEYDRAVLATPDLLPANSRCDWLLAADQWLHPPRQPIIATDEQGNWVALATWRRDELLIAEPLEAYWAFACPIVGPDPVQGVDLLRKVVDSLSQGPVVLRISGVPADGQLQTQLQALPWQWQESYFGITSVEVDFHSGFDSMLAEKPRKFRRNLRRGKRLCEQAGIDYQVANSDLRETFRRILAVEQDCRKFLAGRSIFQEDRFLQFYWQMSEAALTKGDLVVNFARCQGEDVAYILGCTMGKNYRGWQMSYRQDFVNLGVGNQLQIFNMQQVRQIGVDLYDLGMYAEYKSDWASSNHRRVEICGGLESGLP